MEPSSKKRRVTSSTPGSPSTSSVSTSSVAWAVPAPPPNMEVSRHSELPGPSNATSVLTNPEATQQNELDATIRVSQSDSSPTSQFNMQELLLSSPAHLFGLGTAGGPNGQNVTTSWEQWLCFLATNLSPVQWQGYWLAHCALFGEQAVPVHLLSFFQGQSPPLPTASGPHQNDPIQEGYGTYF
uniref:Uncharacterized protein n=1 Tax=Caenorhabditis japonica TaxID=281687 RepID=A0A8R1DYA5_CAEJA